MRIIQTIQTSQTNICCTNIFYLFTSDLSIYSIPFIFFAYYILYCCHSDVRHFFPLVAAASDDADASGVVPSLFTFSFFLSIDLPPNHILPSAAFVVCVRASVCVCAWVWCAQYQAAPMSNIMTYNDYSSGQKGFGAHSFRLTVPLDSIQIPGAHVVNGKVIKAKSQFQIITFYSIWINISGVQTHLMRSEWVSECALRVCLMFYSSTSEHIYAFIVRVRPFVQFIHSFICTDPIPIQFNPTHTNPIR